MRDYQFYLMAPDMKASVPPTRRRFPTDSDALLYATTRATARLAVDVWCEGRLVCKVPCSSGGLAGTDTPLDVG